MGLLLRGFGIWNVAVSLATRKNDDHYQDVHERLGKRFSKEFGFEKHKFFRRRWVLAWAVFGIRSSL